MTDIAIRVDNLSKLYPARSLRARHLGAVHQRPDTTSADLSAGLRDALTGVFARKRRNGPAPTDHRSPVTDHGSPDDLWALKDVSFDACPEGRRRIKRGEVVGSFSGSANLW